MSGLVKSLKEARFEIDRLTKENEHNKSQLGRMTGKRDRLSEEIEALKAEVATLKETAEGDDIAHRGIIKLYDRAEQECDWLREQVQRLTQHHIECCCSICIGIDKFNHKE